MHVASLGFGHADARCAAPSSRRASVGRSSSPRRRSSPGCPPPRRPCAWRPRSACGRWEERLTILRPTMIYGDAGDRNLSRLIRFVARCPSCPSRRRACPGSAGARRRPRPGRRGCSALRGRRRAGVQPARRRGRPLRDLVLHVGRLLGRRLLLLTLPLRPMAALAGAWYRLGLPPRVSAEQVLRLAEDKAFSFEDARRDWGYAPRGFREGLTDEVGACARRAGSRPVSSPQERRREHAPLRQMSSARPAPGPARPGERSR